MASFDSHVGDIGTEFIACFQTLDCNSDIVALDISTQTSIILCFKKPDESIVEQTAAFTAAPCGTGDGTDGKASYITVGGDLDVAGTWRLAGKVILAGGITFRSKEEPFTVRTPVCS